MDNVYNPSDELENEQNDPVRGIAIATAIIILIVIVIVAAMFLTGPAVSNMYTNTMVNI